MIHQFPQHNKEDRSLQTDSGTLTMESPGYGTVPCKYMLNKYLLTSWFSLRADNNLIILERGPIELWVKFSGEVEFYFY